MFMKLLRSRVLFDMLIKMLVGAIIRWENSGHGQQQHSGCDIQMMLDWY